MAEFDVTAQIQEALTGYRDDIVEDIKKQCKRIAKEACEKVTKNSPERTEKYSKGWRVKMTVDRNGAGATVYNKTDYQITHLLEFGHAKGNGGRVLGRAHIKPVETEAVRAFEAAVEEAIQG